MQDSTLTNRNKIDLPTAHTMGDSVTLTFEQIFDTYHGEMVRYAGFKVNDRAHMEDIVAGTFLKFWERFSSDEKIENPRALLYTIAHGLVVDSYRSKARRKSMSLEEMGEVFEIDSGDDFVKELDNKRNFEAILASLPELKDEYHEALVLHYVQGMPVAECALILGRTENSFRVTLHRALAKLRAILHYE